MKIITLTPQQAARAFDYNPTEESAKHLAAYIARHVGEPDELGGYQLTEQLKQAIDNFFCSED
jgi:hypothetical protein